MYPCLPRLRVLFYQADQPPAAAAAARPAAQADPADASLQQQQPLPGFIHSRAACIAGAVAAA